MLTGEKPGGAVLTPRHGPRHGLRLVAALSLTFFLLILIVAKDRVLVLGKAKRRVHTPQLDAQQLRRELEAEIAGMAEAIWSVPAADVASSALALGKKASATNPWDRLRLESERFAQQLQALQAEAEGARQSLEEARGRLGREERLGKVRKEAVARQTEAKLTVLRQQLEEAKQKLASARAVREEGNKVGTGMSKTFPEEDHVVGLGRGFAASSCIANESCQHRAIGDGTLTVFATSAERLLCSACLEGGQKALEFPTGPAPRPSEDLCYRYCCNECTMLLLPLPMQSPTTMFSHTYPTIQGTKDVNVYQAMAPSGAISIVKFDCIQGFGRIGAMRYGHPERICVSEPKRVLLPLAVHAMASEAGIADVAVAHWTEEVHSVTPVTGVPVELKGLFMEPAKGVPLASLITIAPEDKLRDLLASVPINDIAQAAVLDLLFHNTERDPQDVFVSEEGRLKLIDHDGMLTAGEGRLLDSVFLPGTASFGALDTRYRRFLDYRCRVNGGAIRTNYPPSVTSFLLKLKSMNAAEFSLSYNLYGGNHLFILKQMAEDMLTQGFEAALENALRRDAESRDVNIDQTNNVNVDQATNVNNLEPAGSQTLVAQPQC